jgi:hypothetical protein
MKAVWVTRLLAAFVVLGLTVSVASADESITKVAAKLTGFEQVPPVLTNGTGSFTATVRGESIEYKLTYSGLTTATTQAHIHFGQRAVNGGIFLWLCGSAAAPGPAGTPTCPATGGTVTRTVSGADIIAPKPDQGLDAGNFAGALHIIRSGVAYVNVHTTRFPAGEIRGQVRAED